MEALRLAGGGERVGDLLHLADPAPALLRRRLPRRAAAASASSGAASRHSSSIAVRARDVADREQHRRRALRPRGVRHLHRRRARDDARRERRAGEERGDGGGVGAREVERRAGLGRRAADDAAVDEPRLQRRDLRARAAARSRSRRRRSPSKPAHARATSTAACGGQIERITSASPASAVDACRRRGSRGARARRVAPAFGRPDHLAVDARADRRPHLARMQQPDDHRTSASTNTKNATRDDAVHREERRVEPAQVARPDERVLVEEQAADRDDAEPVEDADVQPEPGGDEQRERRQVQRARAGERAALAEARRPRVQALRRGRRRRRRARRRGRSRRPTRRRRRRAPTPATAARP